MPTHVNDVPVNFDHPPPMIVPSSQVNPTPSKTKKVASTKTPAKTPVQPSKLRAAGKGSKSGVGNRRDGGDSDEEIAKLTKAQMDASAVKTNMEDIKPENPCGLTEKDKLAAVQYIVAPEQWKEFRLMQFYSYKLLIFFIGGTHIAFLLDCKCYSQEACYGDSGSKLLVQPGMGEVQGRSREARTYRGRRWGC